MITPFSVPWVAVIEDFDVTTAEEDELALLAKDCFLKCPVIVFRKQPETTTAKQFFEFVQKFDPDVDMDAIENEVFFVHFGGSLMLHMLLVEKRTRVLRRLKL